MDTAPVEFNTVLVLKMAFYGLVPVPQLTGTRYIIRTVCKCWAQARGLLTADWLGLGQGSTEALTLLLACEWYGVLKLLLILCLARYTLVVLETSLCPPTVMSGLGAPNLL